MKQKHVWFLAGVAVGWLVAPRVVAAIRTRT